MTVNVEEEDKKNEVYRVYAAMSFAIVLIVIGLPLWWKTTEVYRVPLPYSRISALNHNDFVFVVNVTIAALDIYNGHKLADDLKDLFKTSGLFDLTCTVIPSDSKMLANVRSLHDLELTRLSRKKIGELLLLEVPGLARFTSSHVLVGKHRAVYFASGTGAVKLFEVLRQWLLQEESLQRMVSAMVAPTKNDLDLSGQRRIPASAAYDIMFTVVNPQPEKLDLNWNVPETIKTYLNPFLKNVASLADYTVKSQWLYFVPLEVKPKLMNETDSMGRHFVLSEDVLPHIITPLEKKLASHVSSNPCLNFVVYTPPCNEAPLHIYRRDGGRVPGSVDAFLSPRWGGIVIHNPSLLICHNNSLPDPKLVELDSEAIMGVFLVQLRLLMGLPQQVEIVNSEIMPAPVSGIRQWEMDYLYRMRTLEQLTSAQLTLQSLSQLLGEISNIVINDKVGASIYKAVRAIEEGKRLMHVGELRKAFEESHKAFLAAEAAFTDPSLLALLYFPDDQKYAVYIPLFLPVMIPVLTSLKNIYKWVHKQVSQGTKEKKE